MSSRRLEKDARRQARAEGEERPVRDATRRLVALGRQLGHAPEQIRADILRGLQEALGTVIDTRSIVVDGRSGAPVDHSSAFRQALATTGIDRRDPRSRERCSIVVRDELEHALKAPG